MYYVNILQSLISPERFYVGITENLKRRLTEHNAGKSIHCNKYKPWKIRTCLSFDNEERDTSFEKYLKSASGRAFMTKRF